jgi:hypothetical protein
MGEKGREGKGRDEKRRKRVMKGMIRVRKGREGKGREEKRRKRVKGREGREGKGKRKGREEIENG